MCVIIYTLFFTLSLSANAARLVPLPHCAVCSLIKAEAGLVLSAHMCLYM